MQRIDEIIGQYALSRKHCIPLVASENRSSDYVRKLLSCDLTDRYYIPKKDKDGKLWGYPHQDGIREAYEHTVSLAKRVFNGVNVSLSALSGNQCVAGALFGCTENGDTVIGVGSEHGGHWALRTLSSRLGVRVIDLPIDSDTLEPDMPQLERLVGEYKPRFLMLDASHTLFPYSVKTIRKSVGSEVPIFYDISHTMGLVAGGAIANPLDEGASCIHGSTHKSLFGPQKGLLVFKDQQLHSAIEPFLHPVLASNVHLHHMAALAGALEEIEAFGARYTHKVVENARFLGRCLSQRGLQVAFESRGYTQTHQIWLPMESKDLALEKFEELENCRLLVNLVELPFHFNIGFRLGCAEITRLGYEEQDIETVADLIADVILGKSSGQSVKEKVRELASAKAALKFALP